MCTTWRLTSVHFHGFSLFLLQLVHSHTQISCKIHSRFSVHTRLVRDRPRVKSSHKASLLKTKVQSYCHLAIMRGSGAGSLKPQFCGGAIVASLHKDGTSRCRLAQGPERPGQAANVRWNAAVKTFDAASESTRASSVRSLTRCCRTDSDHPGSLDRAG